MVFIFSLWYTFHSLNVYTGGHRGDESATTLISANINIEREISTLSSEASHLATEQAATDLEDVITADNKG